MRRIVFVLSALAMLPSMASAQTLTVRLEFEPSEVELPDTGRAEVALRVRTDFAASQCEARIPFVLDGFPSWAGASLHPDFVTANSPSDVDEVTLNIAWRLTDANVLENHTYQVRADIAEPPDCFPPIWEVDATQGRLSVIRPETSSSPPNESPSTAAPREVPWLGVGTASALGMLAALVAPRLRRR
jgi:hypothetical protein